METKITTLPVHESAPHRLRRVGIVDASGDDISWSAFARVCVEAVKDADRGKVVQHLRYAEWAPPVEATPTAEDGELQYPEPTAEQRAKAAELRQRARDCDRSRQESIARSGVSDGFLSQWASGLSASEYILKAELLEQGGVEIFEGLYRRSDGKRVRAKLISGKYGPCWAFCDQQGKFTGRFLSDSKGTKRSKLYREGFEKRDELAPAYAKITGSGTGLSGASTCYVAVRRGDGGYPEDAVQE